MTRSDDLSAIEKWISNSLSDVSLREKAITGIIGDAPSHYSRSPSLWNAAFEALGLEAVYLPFDIGDDQLPHLLTFLRQCERFWGANVTVPHKLRIMKLLDAIDPGAGRIDAVNTIVRTKDGRLIGYNTDGDGFVQSILQPPADRSEPFISSLSGMKVLLIGAGGSARAVAFHIADLLDSGKLLICNRTIRTALALANSLRQYGRQALALSEAQIDEQMLDVGLIINSTTKGQGGIRKLSDGRVTKLEPYSALAPANPPAFPASEPDKSDFDNVWLQAARPDVESNNELSLRLARAIPAHVRFYDLIYHPEETVFLRHGRLTGHIGMNGKAMIIDQAAIAFYKYICREHLKSRGIEGVAAQKQILNAMERAW